MLSRDKIVENRTIKEVKRRIPVATIISDKAICSEKDKSLMLMISRVQRTLTFLTAIKARLAQRARCRHPNREP